MGTYTLKLFRARYGAGVHEGVGWLTFDARNDLIAIEQATAETVEDFAECDHTELWGPDGRLVWEGNRPDP